MELQGLRIADDPAYSTDDFLTTDRAFAVVRVWPLLERRIEVRRIAVHDPHVTIIRTAKGVNIDSLGRKPGSGTRAAAPQPTTPDPPSSLPAFAIALVNLDNGTVRYVDRTGAKPNETTITPLHVRLSDLSLTTPMRVEVEATTVGTPASTFRLHGTVGPIGDPPFSTDVPIEHHVAVKTEAFQVTDLTVTGRVRRTESGTPIANVRLMAPSL